MEARVVQGGIDELLPRPIVNAEHGAAGERGKPFGDLVVEVVHSDRMAAAVEVHDRAAFLPRGREDLHPHAAELFRAKDVSLGRGIGGVRQADRA